MYLSSYTLNISWGIFIKERKKFNNLAKIKFCRRAIPCGRPVVWNYLVFKGCNTVLRALLLRFSRKQHNSVTHRVFTVH